MTMKLFYEDIYISDFETNRSMTVEEILDQLEFDEQAFIDAHGFDAIDYNDFHILTGVDADRAHTRRLLTQFDELERDPRADDEEYHADNFTLKEDCGAWQWLLDHVAVCDELTRMYIRHIASEEWIFNSITLANEGEQFDSTSGIIRNIEELREWAEE